jgi:hypothetical protein
MVCAVHQPEKSMIVKAISMVSAAVTAPKPAVRRNLVKLAFISSPPH